PEALWAVFENEGSFREDVQSIFGRFYREWLPFSGYRYAKLPDMEVYPLGGGRNAFGHSEVWIAIE
ncbi:MAG: GyrI-like domain-containing protein, partial [Acetatifactor sp.]|nr:GyrI-like domain-containing protein [Acetatifactor sp.]